MPSKHFKSLQKNHEELLQRQLNLTDEDNKTFSEDVKEFIVRTRKAGAAISLIQEREQLRANIRYWANYVYGVEKKLPDTTLDEAISSQKMLSINIYTGVLILTAILIIGILLVVSQRISDAQQVVTIQTLTVQLTTTSSLLRYNFDDGSMGWKYQTFVGSRAITGVQPSSEPVKFGRGSLELQVDLIGQDQQNSKGETFVDFTTNPPKGETAPLNLNGKPIIMWVYVPSNAIGDSRVPNAVQLFVKDLLNRSQYGDWVKLTTSNTNQWIPISMTPTDQKVKDYKTDPDYDPTRIKILGLKIGADDRSTASFKGSIWIGGVYWP